MSPRMKKKVTKSPRTTKVTTSKSAPKNTKLSTEEKLKQRGMSDAQAKAFAKNASRHEGADNTPKKSGKVQPPPRTTVTKNPKATPRRTRKGK